MTINNYAECANMGDLGIFVVLRKTKNQSFQVPQQNIYCEYKKKYYQDEAGGLLNKMHELSLWGVDKNKLIAVFEDKKFLLYGAGGISKNIISVKELRKNIVAIADIDKNKHGKYIGDIEIISPEKMVNFTNNILVTIDIDKDGITNYLKDIFESHVNIFFLNS